MDTTQTTSSAAVVRRSRVVFVDEFQIYFLCGRQELSGCSVLAAGATTPFNASSIQPTEEEDLDG